MTLREIFEASIESNKETIESNRRVLHKLGREHRWLIALSIMTAVWIASMSVFGMFLYKEINDTHRQANATADLAESNRRLLELALPALAPTPEQAAVAAARTLHNIDCIASKVANLLDPRIPIKEGC